jgi:nucleotide-binding universal stress UspA family protein
MTQTTAAHAPQATGVDPSARPFSDVLCAVDGTRRSFAAVEQAATLAGSGGRLTLLAVTAVAGSGAYRQASISPLRAERILKRAGRIATEAGVASSTLLDPSGPPPEIIMERASEHDLLSIGAPASSWLGGKFLDGVAVSVLGSFTRPLLLARALREREGRFPERIVLASDGLERSDELVELTGRLGALHGSIVTLCHAIGSESSARRHRVHQQALRLEEALGARSELRAEPGPAAELIVAAAQETSASLVVMGTRRLRGLKAIGSVSARVAHRADCSVLLVPPEYPEG